MAARHELRVYEYVNRLMRRAPHLALHLTDLFEYEIRDADDFRQLMIKLRDAGIYYEVRALLRHLAVEMRTGQYADGSHQWPS